MAAQDSLSDLVESLRADGSVESEGHFTLDREQARTKMQKFQLADARRYVLELVQAAVLRGAQIIDFQIDADDMHMRFDGPPFRAAEIDDLYGSLFRPGDGRELRAVRQLAIGLNAAIGMAPKHILLRSGRVELRVQPGRPDEIIEQEREYAGTHIHVRKRASVGVIIDFFANLTGRLAEERYLRERCVSLEPAIALDGERIGVGPGGDAQFTAMSMALDGPDFKGHLMITGDGEPTRVHLVKDGVWIDSRDLPDCGTGLLAVVAGEQLRKDVSQAKIVDDRALTAIMRAIRAGRWQLWRQAIERSEGDARLLARVHTQLLEHAALSELRGNDNVHALAETLTWPEARGDHPQVSLRRLIDVINNGGQPRYANGKFPELQVEGAPILAIRQSEAQRIGKALNVDIAPARSLLERERLRARGRAEWLERVAPARLPDHITFQYRAPITGDQLGGDQLDGEVGIDHESQAAGLEHPAQVMLHLEGHLLGRLELDAGIPNVWLAIEAPFTPTDNYRDAVRDKAFIRALLAALVGLAGPLAQLGAAVQADAAQTAGVRGLIKRWLIQLLDPRSQVALLTRAGVDVGRDHYIDVGQLSPSLSRAGLLGDDVHPIAQLPLFPELDGGLASLAVLARRHAELGRLPYLDRAPEDTRISAPGVVLLGPGDRKIVRALFGKDIEPYDLGPQQRRLEFMDRPQLSAAEVRKQLALTLTSMALRADDWIVDLQPPVHGCLLPAYAELGARVEQLDDEALARTTIRVLHGGRWLCEVEAQLGLGPLVAVVESPALQPNEAWDGLIDDEAWQQVLTQLRAAAEQLFERLCAIAKSEVGSVARWVSRVLLRAISERTRAGRRDWLAKAADLPMFECVSGRTISFAALDSIIAAHGHIEVVSRETSWAAVQPPEIIKLSDGERGELVLIYGQDKLADGNPRVRHHQVFDTLSTRPVMQEPVFESRQVLVSLPIKDHARRGHIGIARARAECSLFLRLGTGGFHLRDVHAHDDMFWVPLDAVIVDDEIPLDGEGGPNLDSKRYRTMQRQLHRLIPSLVLELCNAWPRLNTDDQRRAWARLLAYMQRETSSERRQVRQRAFDAASSIAGFVDVWGRSLSLRNVLSRASKDPVRALSRAPSPPPPTAYADELILQLDANELACLRAHVEVRLLDDCWATELERLHLVAMAPPLARPKLQTIALTQRKAAVAGDLDCELWLPRDWSPLDSDEPLLLDFARGDRSVARHALSEILPCAGIVTGDGLIVSGPETALDDRQRASLLKQALIMYLDAATRVKAGKVSGKDEPALLAYLAWADHRIRAGGDAVIELGRLGKQFDRLRALLQEIVPPTLRDALQGTPSTPSEPDPPPPEPQAPAPEPATEPIITEPPPPLDPPARLLAALEEQLRWARHRHRRVLGELRLDHIELRATQTDAIAEVQLIGVAVNVRHPLIERLLAQDPIDRYDLAFAVAAIYALLNRVAEDITDDDEREFVAQLTEGLVLAMRAERP